MQVGVLTTNGGPHPADKWARSTAFMISNHLIVVDEKAVSKDAVAVREARDQLNNRLYALLKPHHDTVQRGERAKIKQLGAARLSHPLRQSDQVRDKAVAEHVDVAAIMKEIVAAADVHPKIKAHFAKTETQDVIRQQVLRDFASAMDIERDWFARGRVVNDDGVAKENLDFDPRDPNVKAHKSARAKVG